jgi:predicted transcriptional regulator
MTQISDAESRIMEALWRRSPLSAERIIDKVASENGWAPGTVRTLITRLLHKKAIAGARTDEGYFYSPLIERADWVQAESQSLLDRLFKGQLAPMVAHFAEHRQLTAKEIRQLKALIARIEEGEGDA